MKHCVFLAALAALLSAQAPPPAALTPETVVAKVDGKDVTVGEITAMLQHSGDPRILQAFQQNPKYIVQQLFVMRYLAAQGEQAKLGERSPFKEELEMMRMNAIAVAMVNQERDGYSVTKQAIDDFYAKNQPRYQQAKIKVIFIRFKPGATPTPQAVDDAARAAFESAHNPDARTEPDAKKLASDVVTKIRGGADFSKLVAEVSEDPESKRADGDFGVVKPTSSYPEEFKRAVFALKPGEVSDPVRQPNGFYVIRVEEKSAQPVEEVTEPIIQEIRQSHLGEWMANLNKRFEPAIENQQFFDQPARAVAPNK